MRRIVESRCQEFLETQPTVGIPNSDIIVADRIVVDFLQKEEVAKYIREGTTDEFDPIKSLAAAALAGVKSTPPVAKKTYL